MTDRVETFQEYFHYLNRITLRGLVYKRLISSPILFFCARAFGSRLIEVGSGTGAGVLGTFPSSVVGLEINPFAVEHSKGLGLRASLIPTDGSFPLGDASFDACILDNVLEHIDDPQTVLDECYRITSRNGGLVVAVPGTRGFAADPDHKVFYGEAELRQLDERWKLHRVFSIPIVVRSTRLSRSLRQYCLVAVYHKLK